jgi:uncharacterized protein
MSNKNSVNTIKESNSHSDSAVCGPIDESLFPGIKVAMTNVGRGVFAKRDFRAGEFVLAFHGPVVGEEVGRELSDTVQIAPDRYVDPIPPVKYVNHSCVPNTGLKNGIELHAIRPIKAGEQICFDYSTCMGEKYWTMECECGCPECRGVVRDFEMIPSLYQHRYIQLQVVQDFLMEKYVSG